MTTISCSKNEYSGETVDRIKSAGVLKIATCAQYPPFETHDIDGDTDEIVGWDIELAQKIADELGVELEIKDYSFDAVLVALASGDVDLVISGLGVKKERTDQFQPSDPYYYSENVIISTKENATTYSTLASLKGKKIGAQESSIQASLAREYIGSDVSIIDMEYAPDYIAALKAGSIDVVIFDSIVANDYLKVNSDLAITEANFDGIEAAQEPKVAYMPKDEPDLLAVVNDTISKYAAEIYQLD